MYKKEAVKHLFNGISKHYDFLNHFLSLGVDIYWRNKAIKLLKERQPKKILDIATGTGDLAIEALAVSPDKVTGIDISCNMLNIGREKIRRKKLEDRIELMQADAENLPFNDNSFDAVTVGFGVRNFENLERGLSGMHRVLKHGGMAVILEFSNPQRFPVKQVYNFYFQRILPIIGRLISKHNSAYTYLPQSVKDFPDGIDFITRLEKAGFKSVRRFPLSFGIVTIYVGEKCKIFTHS